MHLKEAIDKLYNLAVNNGIGQYEGSYEQAFDMVIEELEKKEAIMNEMAEWINRIDSTIFCNKSECNDNCKECVIKEFTNKVEKEGIKDEQSR